MAYNDRLSKLSSALVIKTRFQVQSLECTRLGDDQSALCLFGTGEFDLSVATYAICKKRNRP